MAIDQSIIEVMAAAVEREPHNVALRMHLASLLWQGGRAQETLDHCRKILADEPDHLEALALGAQAAEAVGDRDRADAYRRLSKALSGGHDTPQGPATESGSRDKAAGEIVDDFDFTTIGDDSFAVATRKAEGKESLDDVLLDVDDDIWETETPTLKLADVGGMEEVKRRLNMAFIAPLNNPELMKMYGKSLRGGLLLYGPPGCGKTFIARAVAGELKAKFVAVGLSDVLDMWIGSSEKNLHEIFEIARRNSPCVLFFDEVDALGQKRSLMRHSAARNVVNQLLAEMDTVGRDNEGVFVLAATNHPWDVDTALRRPGRLDRTLLVLPPDRPARETILRYHMRERPADRIDFDQVAAKTEDFSGADLAHLCESAVELAMEESLASGTPRPISQNDFKRSLKAIKPSTRAWFDTARNYAMFANEGGVYDELLSYLRERRML